MSCYRRFFSHLNCYNTLFSFSLEQKHSGFFVSRNLFSFHYSYFLRNFRGICFINYKIPYCFLFFHILPFFVWTVTPSCPFSEWNCPTFLCMKITQTPCVSSPSSLCECHTCASPFSLCFLLVHNWPILVLTLCWLPHLIS